MTQDNVVEFKPRTAVDAEQEERDLQAEYDSLPEEAKKSVDRVRDLVEKANEHVEQMYTKVDETIIGYAEENIGEKIDITVPLEALAHTGIATAQSLDVKILPEVMQKHHQIRNELSDDIRTAIRKYIEVKDEPVYTQDLYVALYMTIVNELQQNRTFQFIRQVDRELGQAEAPQDTEE